MSAFKNTAPTSELPKRWDCNNSWLIHVIFSRIWVCGLCYYRYSSCHRPRKHESAVHEISVHYTSNYFTGWKK